jgi:hypothetical protein
MRFEVFHRVEDSYMYFRPLSYDFVRSGSPFRSQYWPQHPVLQHTQSVFPYCGRPSVFNQSIHCSRTLLQMLMATQLATKYPTIYKAWCFITVLTTASPSSTYNQPELVQSRFAYYYQGADKSLARPTSRCILFDGENISFDATLVIYINSTNIPPIMIINRIYEHQNLLSL